MRSVKKDPNLPAPGAVWGANRTPAKKAALFDGMKKNAATALAKPEDTQRYKDGLVLVAEFSAGSDTPVEFSNDVAGLVPNLIAAVGAIVDGVRFGDLDKECGLTNYELRLCATYDRNGFRKLYDWAQKERKRVRAERIEDLLAEKAAAGIERPVVVRRGRDNDEIEMVAVQSERLIATATEVLRQGGEGGGGQTNIGQQTVYNIQLPDYLLKSRKPEKVIEAAAD